MLKNNIKIAWRSLKNQPFFTFLNTFGLAIGIAGALLISLYIYDEFSYDKMFVDADRIYRVNVETKFGSKAEEFAAVQAPLASAVNNDYEQVEMATRFGNWGSVLIKQVGEVVNVKELEATLVDDTFFDMFGLELLVGDTKTALKEPNTLILTRTAAEKHFKIDEAVGQNVILDNNKTYVVTGVIDDMPQNSFLRSHSVFMSMASVDDGNNLNVWDGNNFNTFIKLIPNYNVEDFQIPLQSLFERYLIPHIQSFVPGTTAASFEASGKYVKYSTIALTDIHLRSNRISEISPNSDIQSIYILSFIGLFLLVLASVNFMNLSTAHSLKRAKEVGIRKTLGSNKYSLIRQFLTESGLISFASLVIALVMAVIAMPFFNELSGKEISIPFTNPIFWLVLIFAGILLGLFSGSYPAFFMSKFTPVKVLKGGGESSVGGGGIRNTLVVFQFTISVFLIVSTLIVFQQLQFIQSKDLGYTKDRLLIIEDVYATGNQIESFKNEVQQLGMVEHASLSSFLPTPSNRQDSGFQIDGIVEQQDNVVQLQRWDVDYDYVSTLDLEIIAGRAFDKQFSNDSSGIIINETALAMLGVQPEDALGVRLTRNFNDENSDTYTVIGVVKNFHYESLKDNIGALSLYIGDSSNKLIVKLSAGDFSNTIANIEETWNKVAPEQPFNYYFMDESFNSTYEAEQRLGAIFIIFTILSILIACLGLFGLAAFNAEKRTKEIGIRKVLGASVGQISYRLSVDFLKLVGIAILISLPIGWYAMNKWLEDFSYRIEIPWWVFALAAFLAVAISILTVSYQSIKAAIVNPIKSLRTE